MKLSRLPLVIPVLALLLGGFSTGVLAQEKKPTASHLAIAKEMLRVTRADQMMKQITGMVVPEQRKTIKSLRPDIPDKILDRFIELFRAAMSRHMGDFLDVAAIAYTRHMSEEDMKAAVKFFKTDAGQRILAAQPILTRELFQIGSAMGREISNKATREAREQLGREGYKL